MRAARIFWQRCLLGIEFAQPAAKRIEPRAHAIGPPRTQNDALATRDSLNELSINRPESCPFSPEVIKSKNLY
jgi:hypothetical protein